MLDPEMRESIFTICNTREELKDWIYVHLDLELPDAIVDPDSNTTPLDMAWATYSHFAHYDPNTATGDEAPRVLYYSARDAGKTLTQSVVEVLALFHLDISVVHLAAIEEQSTNAQKYLKKFLSRQHLRGFVAGDSKRKTGVILYRPVNPGGLVLTEKEFLSLPEREHSGYFRVENQAEIVVATITSTNGKHSPLLCLDEIDIIVNIKAYEEAKNIPTPLTRRDGVKVPPLTILTSTRKTAFGIVQDEINNADKTGLKIKHFNILDVTEACPPKRHRPDLPKLKVFRSTQERSTVDEDTYNSFTFKQKESYTEDMAYSGCMTNCKLFSACKGNLATRQTNTSKFLKPIKHVQDQLIKVNSIEMGIAQLLCLKPASTGLIYHRFDRKKHVLTPAEAYEKVFGELPEGIEPRLYTKAMFMAAMAQRDVEWNGGIDWGSTHNFAFGLGFKDGARQFITNAIMMPGLDPDQMLEVSEPYKDWEAKIYPDTADPKMNKMFRKNGWKIQNWSKKPGSVVSGINIVRKKLNPGTDEPELFFVLDIDDDQHMEAFIRSIVEYHWKNDAAGKPTNIPSEDNDDGADCVRYIVMNVFSMDGGLAVSNEKAQAETTPKPHADWMRNYVASKTGGMEEEVSTVGRPPMRIENPDGSSVFSYYGEEESSSQKPGKKKKSSGQGANSKTGKTGKLSWDLG